MSKLFCMSFRGFAAFVLITLTTTYGSAQCGRGTTGINGIGTESGRPFQADRVTTSVQTLADGSRRTVSFTDYVARDSTGRIRIERLLSLVASEADFKAAARQIIICDPNAGSSIVLDTRNQTATVVEDPTPAQPHRARRSYSSPFFPSAATRLPTNVLFEDLGYKTIEGVVAHGGRHTQLTAPQVAGSGGSPIRTDERWSSDDLAADVLEVHTDLKTGNETRIALTRLRRSEPEASLFEIPAGYSITKTALPASPK